jgi:hypothetical protein
LVDQYRLTVGLIMSFHDLLAFNVLVVNYAVILMDFPLYVTCLLSFLAFRILSLFFFSFLN